MNETVNIPASEPAKVDLGEPLPLTRTIVLVGLMGSGKSCIGRRLAQRLNVPFVDADYDKDNWFARARGMPSRDIVPSQYITKQPPRRSTAIAVSIA